MPLQPGGQQPSPPMHWVMMSHAPAVQVPMKHLFTALSQSSGTVQIWQPSTAWHFWSMQLPVKHGWIFGSHSICFAQGLQFGTWMHSPLIQSPVLHGSTVGSQSLASTQGGAPPAELDDMVPHPSQVQPG